MKILPKILGSVLLSTAVLALPAIPAMAQAAPKLGAGLTMYFQMGGNPGDGATLPREIGAKAAADMFGVKLVEQFSSWQPETMISEFRQAMAASPDCIEIMGHPGDAAFMPLVTQAENAGIMVTAGNVPLEQIEAKYRQNGFGYAGTFLFPGGEETAAAMVAEGHLKPGDEALEYGLFSEGARGQSDRGLAAGLEKAGLKVSELTISPEVDANSSLAVPILVAYIERHPNLKAIGTQHGLVTSFIPQALKEAGKKPGEIIVGGIDLAPATVAGLESGYITVVLNQQLYLQGFLPVVQCVMSKRYYIPGLDTNTASGTVNGTLIKKLVPLIKSGIE
ncbi:MAG TPA: substrate-binding domain-containing protein [Acetobacteraceae bacterium]|jgi:simple sugar transport system substrate-binding protein|nr:substrate-binding domain-containing protein [Acetobacteraceae bacterium]